MKQSLFRQLTYKILSKTVLSGSVIDLGGNSGAYYHHLFQGEFEITTLNMEGASSADIIWDLEKAPLPIEDKRYNAVLLINVLEHIYHWDNLLKECQRILKPNGKLVAVIPFLYYLHPSPNDYFRYSRQALEKMFAEAGFSDIKIQELGPGAFSAAYNLIHRFFPPFMNFLLVRVAVGADSAARVISKMLGKKYTGDEYPLGYFIMTAR
jgi:SAM-dependent methyltransferase